MTTRDLLCVPVCVCSPVPSPFLDSTLNFRTTLLPDSQRHGGMWLSSEVLQAAVSNTPHSGHYPTSGCHMVQHIGHMFHFFVVVCH